MNYHKDMNNNKRHLYAAILCDLRASRSFNNLERVLIQEKLARAMQIVNELYREKYEYGFEFSSGDSIQALFLDSKTALECCFLLRTLISPYELRFGIGIGPINNLFFKIKKSDWPISSNFLDGSAYHLAIEALNKCRTDDLGITINSGKREQDHVLNRLLRNSYLSRKDQSLQRRIITTLYDIISPVHFGAFFLEKYYASLEKITDIVFFANEELTELINKDAKTIINESVKRKIGLSAVSNQDTVITNGMFSPRDDYYVSVILKVSEQNVSNIRRKAELKEIRNDEIAVCNFLGAAFGTLYDN